MLEEKRREEKSKEEKSKIYNMYILLWREGKNIF